MGGEKKAVIIDRQFKRGPLTVNYPIISGLNNRWIEHKINMRIRQEINGLIEFQGFPDSSLVEVLAEYAVMLNDKGILSIKFINYGYRKGAAHGMTFQRALTFDLSNGNIYQLKDLFKEGTDYIDRINKFVKQYFTDEQIPLLTEFKTIDKNQEFYMTEKYLVIFFQIYEYTAYVYGIPEVKIPYTSISDILSTKGTWIHFL